MTVTQEMYLQRTETLSIILDRVDPQVRVGLSLFDSSSTHLKELNSPISHFNSSTVDGTIQYRFEERNKETIHINLNDVPRRVQFMVVSVSCRNCNYGERCTRLRVIRNNDVKTAYTYELNDSEWDPHCTGSIICQIRRVVDHSDEWSVETLGYTSLETISTESDPKYTIRPFCIDVVNDELMPESQLTAEVHVLEGKHLLKDKTNPALICYKVYMDGYHVFTSEFAKKSHARWSTYFKGFTKRKKNKCHTLRIEVWNESELKGKLLGQSLMNINMMNSKTLKECGEWHELEKSDNGGKIKIDLAFKYVDAIQKSYKLKWIGIAQSNKSL